MIDYDFKYLPLTNIKVSMSNVRRTRLEENLDDLADSIQQNGLQQPVVVYRDNGNYQLIIGQRRYLACKRIGLDPIPAVITEVEDETDALARSFTENIQRLDLDYDDKMRVANVLLLKLGTISKVAKKLGVTDQTIRNYLGYQAVPEEIKNLVQAKKLSVTTATRITRDIGDTELAISVAQRIKEMPRGSDRNMYIDIATENQQEDVEEIETIFRKTKGMRRITIHVTERVYQAVGTASRMFKSNREDLVKEALEEWLSSKRFL